MDVASNPDRSPVAWIILIYFLMAPAVAGVAFFAILTVGSLSFADWLLALPPLIGMTYVVTAVPALLTALTAAISNRGTAWWMRLGPPMLCAIVTGYAVMWLVVRLGEPPQAFVLQATVLASACGALVPGLLVEIFRAYRTKAG